jgi:superfamily II DNA or RNA helicase
MEFADKYNYDCQFNFDVGEMFNEFDEEDIDDVYEKLFGDTDFEPRDYQHEAITRAFTRKRGVIVSPTGSGKSLIIYTLIRLILLAQSNRTESDSILLIVPNVSLVEQMFSDFREYGWTDIDKYVGILYAGKDINLEKPVLISTWQSVHKRKPSFFWMFGALMIDECHGAKSHSINQIARKCINAEYRIGFTGTLPTVEADQYNIFGYLGPKIFDIGTKTLMNKGVLSQITIGNILLKYPPKVVEEIEGASYPHEIRFLIDHAPRNRVFDFIIDSFEDGENALILCQRIKHLKKIETYVRERFPNYDVFTIFKDTKAKDREAIRKSMEHRGNTIIIGTYATMSTGINIKNLHHVIFASSYKSKIKVLQSIGRGLRKHESKDHLILWDIIDDLSWIGPRGGLHKNYVYKHFDQRLEYYDDQGFEYFNKILDLQKINSSEHM